MAIKLVITDLDGTFYHRDMTYDKPRFDRLYKQMKEQGMHFAVASGNQYFQLISFFDHPEEMTFVSENGGYIVHEGKEIFSVEIDKETCLHVLDIILARDDIPVCIVCGKKAAYCKKDFPEDLYKECTRYFPKLIRVDNLKEIDDQIIKFSLACNPAQLPEISNDLRKVVGDNITVVQSGHGDIDLIVNGVHKGYALEQLCDIWHISLDEVMAFGDAMNDLQMLSKAKYGFVMKNGDEKLKQIIGRVSPIDHQHDGELELIEEYLTNPSQFLEKYK